MTPARIIAIVCVLTVTGCASTQEIETSPPQPRTAATPTDGASAREAPITIVLTQGETALPDDIAQLRFRVTEVRFRRTGGDWVRLPSDAAPIEIGSDPLGVRKTLIDTRVEPTRYDSLAITLDNVFVRFGENAGAPLTTAAGTPQELALSVEPSVQTQTVITLALEPGASLTRSPDCRWFFVPVLRPLVTTSSAPASEMSGR